MRQRSPKFNYEQVLFELRRQKFLELLDNQALTPAVMELVDGLKALESQCSKEEFSTLCYCLTLGSLREHQDFAHWTAEKGRLECFEACAPHFETIYGSGSRKRSPVPGGRLLALLRQALLHQLNRHAEAHPEWQVPADSMSISLLADMDSHTPEQGLTVQTGRADPIPSPVQLSPAEQHPPPVELADAGGRADPVRQSVCEEAAELIRKQAVSWVIPSDSKVSRSACQQRATSVEPEQPLECGEPTGLGDRQWTEPLSAQLEPDAMLSEQPTREAEDEFGQWDRNNDGVIDREEFAQMRPTGWAASDPEFDYSIMVPSDLVPAGCYTDSHPVRALAFNDTHSNFFEELGGEPGTHQTLLRAPDRVHIV